MESPIATLREMRLNFKTVREKVERHGRVLITDNGVPAYLLMPAPVKVQKKRVRPDYLARLRSMKSKPLNAEQTRALHEENRGDR